MKILYIWDGIQQPFPEFRQANIKRCFELYPNAEYFCISKKDFFFSSDFKIIDWDSMVLEIENYFPFGKLHGISNSSDWMRFWYLAHNPQTLYMDTDVFLNRFFDFESKTKPMFPTRDIYILYSGAEQAFGNRAKSLMMAEPAQHHARTFGHLVYLPLRFNFNEADTIASDLFIHFN